MNNTDIVNDTENSAMSPYEDRITVDTMQFFHLSKEEQRMDYRDARKKDMEILKEQMQAVKKRLAQPILITGYRFSATGVFGYEFYKGQEKVCEISGIVAPPVQVRIEGKTRCWEAISKRDGVAGCISLVYDQTDQHETFRLLSADDNTYQIWLKDEEFPVPDHWDVVKENRAYQFFFPAEDRWHDPWRLASLERTATADWIPDIEGMDVEPCFLAKVYDNYDEFEEVLLAVLSFPVLKSWIQNRIR